VAVLGLLTLLILGGKRLVDQLSQPVHDSEDFRDALARWSKRIGEAHATPRAAKRLVNKLRFYAMVLRALRASGARAEVPETAIVAFGVLEETLAGGQVLRDPCWAKDGLAGDVADLEASLSRHPELFRYLRASVAVGPRAENPAGSA
jgi:hypothetical protein